MESINEIKEVAIYLRKSRAIEDEADSLAKHRDVLVSKAKRSGWRYKIFEEIASGVDFGSRVELIRLLGEVEAGNFDGVLVMDMARLGRGNDYEWGLILRSFISRSVKIITPDRVFDPEDETDEEFIDMQQHFSRMEYRHIRRRLRNGKKAGTEKGQWTNGKPPFPYYYDTNEKERSKRVKIDQTGKVIYRKIIDMYISGFSIAEIALHLNNNKIKTPAGEVPLEKGLNSGWSTNAVYRLLSDSFHTGVICKQKSRGNPHKGKTIIIPYSQRETVPGQHEAIKTLEEHHQITIRLQEKRKASRAKARKYLFSGVFVCAQCGHHLVMKPRMRVKTGKIVDTALCVYRNMAGEKCKQKGIALTDKVLEQLFSAIIRVDEDFISGQTASYEEQQKSLCEQITLEKKKLAKLDKVRLRIFDSYEAGDYSRTEFIERKNKNDAEHEFARERLKSLEVEMKAIFHRSPVDIIEKISEIKSIWYDNSVLAQDKNRLLLSLVKCIEYNRLPGKPPEFKIEYR